MGVCYWGEDGGGAGECGGEGCVVRKCGVQALGGVGLCVGVGEGLGPCYDAEAGGSGDFAGVGEGAVGGELEIEACVCS